MKRIFFIFVLILVMLSMISCGDNIKENKYKLKVGLITDTGGIKDQGFNENAYSGLMKVAKDFPEIKVSYIESKIDLDYGINAQMFIDNKYDIIIGVGFPMKEAIEEVAKSNPKKKFVLIDESIDLPNVTSILFKSEEAAYMAGVVAAEKTKTKKVGFIKGVNNKLLDAFGAGFSEGVKSVDKSIIVDEYNINSFSDITLCKTVANKMINKGVDIIYIATGGANSGGISACSENNCYAIGVDIDQSYISPDTVITSTLKRLDNAVYSVVKDFYNGKNISGVKYYDLKNDGVGIVKEGKFLSKELINKINNIEKDIINGNIIVKVP